MTVGLREKATATDVVSSARSGRERCQGERCERVVAELGCRQAVEPGGFGRYRK